MLESSESSLKSHAFFEEVIKTYTNYISDRTSVALWQLVYAQAKQGRFSLYENFYNIMLGVVEHCNTLPIKNFFSLTYRMRFLAEDEKISTPKLTHHLLLLLVQYLQFTKTHFQPSDKSDKDILFSMPKQLLFEVNSSPSKINALDICHGVNLFANLLYLHSNCPYKTLTRFLDTGIVTDNFYELKCGSKKNQELIAIFSPFKRLLHDEINKKGIPKKHAAQSPRVPQSPRPTPSPAPSFAVSGLMPLGQLSTFALTPTAASRQRLRASTRGAATVAPTTPSDHPLGKQAPRSCKQ